MGMIVIITTMDALPECCYECPCSNGESGYCQADKERRYSDYRPYWCPLKDIPKEQEAVKPINSYGTFRCRKCKNIVGYNDGDGRGYQNNFCSKCGQAVKWE